MGRTAQCACGQFSVRVSGEPKFVIACSCLGCQRRTGSVFAVNAYFRNEQLQAKSGRFKIHSYVSDAGRQVCKHFCPECGTTVCAIAEFQPGMTCFAVGCFADPNFPQPIASAWNRHRHDWVEFPLQCAASQTQDFKMRSALAHGECG
ncbi:GFA family protein [Cellvibrio sp. OA-2007]|uniref:GFA family protein n=1 Tax=Cellvibrio sp. OA-2007 TaxID=529823 RepID=UPI000A04909D